VTASAGALLVVAEVRSLPAIVVASALAGLGLGLVSRAALAEVSDRAPVDRRGDVVACFYLVIYLGTAVPVIGVGLLAHATDLLGAVRTFDVAVGAACLVLFGLLLGRGAPRRSRRGQTAELVSPRR
jgi:MFS family permease